MCPGSHNHQVVDPGTPASQTPGALCEVSITVVSSSVTRGCENGSSPRCFYILITVNASFLGRLLGIKGAGHPEGPNPVPRTKLNPGKTETFLYAQVVLGLLDIYHQSEKDPTWRGNSFRIALGILAFALKL